VTRSRFLTGIGVLALLVAGVFERLRPARGAIVVAALFLAFLGQVRILQAEPGLVFDATLMANRTTALWGMIFLVATGLAWLFSRHYYEEDRPFETEHDALLLTTPLGMMLMAGAQDLIVFFIGLELLSIPLYALAAFRRNRVRSVEAGLKYFVVGAFASAFVVYGIALLYGVTGTTNLVAMGQSVVAAGAVSPLLAVG